MEQPDERGPTLRPDRPEPSGAAPAAALAAKEPRSFRVMLGLGGAVYLAWWFAVEWLLPGSFNPLAGRLTVVAYFLCAFVLSFIAASVRRHAESLFYVGALFLVGHYFYLFHHNAGDINWVVGTYVVVFALCVGVQSRAWLFVFATFSFGCGLAVWLLNPVLQKTIFLPGLATILALCLAMLLSRLRLLESLSESTSRFQSLFDGSFEGVAVQQGGKIVDVNAAFVTLFGYPREELIGRSVIELNAAECRERVATQIREMPASRYESIGIRKDGSRFAIEISTKPHLYQGRVLRLAAVRDVSDRQRAEQERLTLIQEQLARASAQEAIRIRDEFISIASHELRTPITSLLLQLDAFAQSAGRAQAFESYASRARRQLARMTRLVEELLDVSRLEVQRMTLQKASMDLESLAKSVVESLAEDARRAGCRIAISSDGPVEGLWDRSRLERAVANLVRNALIYGAGKPIELVIKNVGDTAAMLGVRDHGIGIEESLRERIFLRFERGVSARHYGGLGLGLYIAKQIVEAHEGTVRVESELGQGSTFWVELPAHGAPH